MITGWARKFLWFPTKAWDGKWVWLCFMERQRCHCGNWTYRPPKPPYFPPILGDKP